MLQLGDRADLTQEALGPERVGQLGVEYLERDQPVVPDVMGEIDRGHAAVISGLGQAVERPKALAFLELVAAGDGKDYPGSAIDAMASIAAHEEEGSAVLKRLHDTDTIHEPHAVQWLNHVAERGYRIR
jgi:hypothetical protein